jgi:hypothetical protein
LKIRKYKILEVLGKRILYEMTKPVSRRPTKTNGKVIVPTPRIPRVKTSSKYLRDKDEESDEKLVECMKFVKHMKISRKMGITNMYINYLTLDAFSKTQHGKDIVNNSDGITYSSTLNIKIYSEIINLILDQGENVYIEFIYYDGKWIMFDEERRSLSKSDNLHFEVLTIILNNLSMKFYIDEFETVIRVPPLGTEVKCLRKNLHVQTEVKEILTVYDEYKTEWFSHSAPIACRILYKQFLEQKSDLLEFTIETSDSKTIKVHKELISQSESDYLKTLCESSFSESTNNCLKLDYSYSIVMLYLEYLYMGDAYIINKSNIKSVDMESCLKFADYIQDLSYFNTCVKTVEGDNQYTNILWSMRNKMSHNPIFQTYIHNYVKISSTYQKREEKGRSKLISLLKDPSLEHDFEFFAVAGSGSDFVFKYKLKLYSDRVIDMHIIIESGNNKSNDRIAFIIPSAVHPREVRKKMNLLFEKEAKFRDISISKLMKEMKFLSIEVRLEEHLKHQLKPKKKELVEEESESDCDEESYEESDEESECDVLSADEIYTDFKSKHASNMR